MFSFSWYLSRISGSISFWPEKVLGIISVFLIMLRFVITAQSKACLDEHPTCIWKYGVSCCCRAARPVRASGDTVVVFDRPAWVLEHLVHLLEISIETSSYNCDYSYFCFHFYQVLLYVFLKLFCLVHVNLRLLRLLDSLFYHYLVS